MRKVEIKMFSSYKDADMDMLSEYFMMSSKNKVATVNIIRHRIFGLKGIVANNIVKKIISFGTRKGR